MVNICVQLSTNCIYYPTLLTCQMHTNYTVNAHDILIFEKCSVFFVICTDKCGIRFTRTVIAQWSIAQVSHLMVVRSSQLGSRFFTYSFKHCKHVFYLFDNFSYCIFHVLCVFSFCITKQILRSIRLYGV